MAENNVIELAGRDTIVDPLTDLLRATILNVLGAARAMERMGDRCGNIAEYIVYLVHGRDVRHSSISDAVAEIAAKKD